MDADLTRSLAGNRPWMLMEHSTGAVNWQGRNIAKRPGELARNSISHLARGADAVMFFQFRASRFGAEKFHSAMLPHAGTGTRIWREVLDLGDDLKKLSAVKGSTVQARVAILWDVESFWAQDLEWRPSSDLNHRERIEAYYSVLWEHGITADFAHPEADLSGYDLVLAPALYLVGDKAAANLRDYVDGGGHLLVSYFSGIVDSNDTVPAGASPGGLRDVLGLEIHEFLPLRAGGNDHPQQRSRRHRLGRRHPPRPPQPWWPATSTARPPRARPSPATPLAAAPPGTSPPSSTATTSPPSSSTLSGLPGIEAAPKPPEGLEVITRSTSTDSYTFLINHSDADAEYPATGRDLLTGGYISGTAVIPGRHRVRRPGPHRNQLTLFSSNAGSPLGPCGPQHRPLVTPRCPLCHPHRKVETRYEHHHY